MYAYPAAWASVDSVTTEDGDPESGLAHLFWGRLPGDWTLIVRGDGRECVAEGSWV